MSSRNRLTPSAQDQQELRALVDARGASAVAAEFQTSRLALANFLAGLPQHTSTLALITLRLAARRNQNTGGAE